jgi:hypothetical protein
VWSWGGVPGGEVVVESLATKGGRSKWIKIRRVEREKMRFIECRA